MAKMKKKMVFGVLVLLFIGGTVLYAQNNVSLRSGAYRNVYLSGDARVLVFTHNGTIYVNVFDTEGTRVQIGTARIRGTQMNVDYGSGGFDMWTIVDDETFKDTNGFSFIWVRNLRNSEGKIRW
jgi:hypothetical protein